MTLGLWMDGTLIASKTVETKPSGLVYFDPYSEEELRVHLLEGDHVFRAGFIDDAFVRTLPAADSYDRKKNKFLDSIVFAGRLPRPRKRRAGKRPSRAIRRRDAGAWSESSPTSRIARTGVRPHEARSTRFCGSPRWAHGAGLPSRESSSRFRRCWSRPIFSSASSASRTRACASSATAGRLTTLALRAGLARQLLPLELDAG